jgi:hypothetical protein
MVVVVIYYSHQKKGEIKMTIIKNLSGITVGELKSILENVSDETEICVWGPNVDWAEIEVNICPSSESDVFINIETLPSY